MSKIEGRALRPYEASVILYRSTPRHIPDDFIVKRRRSEYLRSRMAIQYKWSWLKSGVDALPGRPSRESNHDSSAAHPFAKSLYRMSSPAEDAFYQVKKNEITMNIITVIFMVVIPCINDIKPFIVQLMHM